MCCMTQTLAMISKTRMIDAVGIAVVLFQTFDKAVASTDGMLGLSQLFMAAQVPPPLRAK